MSLDKLPSVINENRFNIMGLVETKNGVLVPAYVGSQLGFNEPGRIFLNNTFYPKLRELGVLALCPFTACGEYLDFSRLSGDMTVKSQMEFWDEFNKKVGLVNYRELMPRSKFMIALFDGSHAVDDGLSSEIGYFASKHGPVIGIRSDFRLAENPAAPINPAVRYFLDHGPFGGKFFDGPDAYDKAYKDIKDLTDKIKDGYMPRP